MNIRLNWLTFVWAFLIFVFHQVQYGDTLWQLASANHTSVRQIMETNHLQSSTIFPGQELRIYEGVVSEKSGTKDTQQASDGPPLQLIPVYQDAGREFGIPWTVLAAIHRTETDFAMSGGEVSSCGAEGPMQFMPSTFAEYGVTAPGQHRAPDINNVYDAIYSCAHMLAANGYNKVPLKTIYMYNHSASYVESIQQLSQAM